MLNPFKEAIERRFSIIKETIDYLIEKNRLLEALLILYSEIDVSLGSLLYPSCKKGAKNELDFARFDKIIELKTSSKIGLCYALHCIDIGMYEDLHKIRKMRNRFVHHIQPKSVFGNTQNEQKETIIFFKEVKTTLKNGMSLIKTLEELQ